MSRDRSSVRRGVAAVFAGTGQTTNILDEGLKASGAPNGEEVENTPMGKRTPPVNSRNAADASPAVKLPEKAKKRPGEAPEGKVKVTWYIDERLVAKMKHLAVDFKKRDSELAAEGIQDVIEKYEKKRPFW